MFNSKSNKSEALETTSTSGSTSSTSLIGSGTTLKGDISSSGDIRIDGTLNGNIHCTAKVVIGANGVVTGDVNGQQADIMGKVTGSVKVKDLLQLKGGSVINGNLYAGKLQIEPTASFNGECHMGQAAVGNSSNGKASNNEKDALKLAGLATS
ncbi:MAG: polymer-forming cytoskeletal protein [Bacteroidetes bacterium]|nr:polymer-forming cytoskeletal protein [Bacteroidota bacterium]